VAFFQSPQAEKPDQPEPVQGSIGLMASPHAVLGLGSNAANLVIADLRVHGNAKGNCPGKNCEHVTQSHHLPPFGLISETKQADRRLRLFEGARKCSEKQTPGPLSTRASCVTIARQPPWIRTGGRPLDGPPALRRAKSRCRKKVEAMPCWRALSRNLRRNRSFSASPVSALPQSSRPPLNCVARAWTLVPGQPVHWSLPVLRFSRCFLPVLKESPSDAQIVSHK